MQKKTKANKVLWNTYKQLSCFFRSHFRMTSSLSIQTFRSSMNHRSFRINFRVQIISCGQRSLFQGWTTGTGLDFSAWISTQFGRDFFTDGRIWGSFGGPEFGILRVLDGGEGSHVILHVDGGGHRFKIKRPFFFLPFLFTKNDLDFSDRRKQSSRKAFVLILPSYQMIFEFLGIFGEDFNKSGTLGKTVSQPFIKNPDPSGTQDKEL